MVSDSHPEAAAQLSSENMSRLLQQGEMAWGVSLPPGMDPAKQYQQTGATGLSAYDRLQDPAAEAAVQYDPAMLDSVDREVFAALPEEIQLELMNQVCFVCLARAKAFTEAFTEAFTDYHRRRSAVCVCFPIAVSPLKLPVQMAAAAIAAQPSPVASATAAGQPGLPETVSSPGDLDRLEAYLQPPYRPPYTGMHGAAVPVSPATPVVNNASTQTSEEENVGAARGAGDGAMSRSPPPAAAPVLPKPRRGAADAADFQVLPLPEKPRGPPVTIGVFCGGDVGGVITASMGTTTRGLVGKKSVESQTSGPSEGEAEAARLAAAKRLADAQLAAEGASSARVAYQS